MPLQWLAPDRVRYHNVINCRSHCNALPVGNVLQVRAKGASVMQCVLERRIDSTDDYYRNERLLDFQH